MEAGLFDEELEKEEEPSRTGTVGVDGMSQRDSLPVAASESVALAAATAPKSDKKTRAQRNKLKLQKEKINQKGGAQSCPAYGK